MNNYPIRRALISVSDKTGLSDLGQFLDKKGVEIISTGGTAKFLKQYVSKVTDISDYTGFPECFDGRVKTLHPMIHGGLLFKRFDSSHVSVANDLGISAIDLIVVNLYPFEQTIAKEGCTLDEAVENIDIGGPGMLRSASKNYESVTVITDTVDYSRLISEMDANNNATTMRFRLEMAKKVFYKTSNYDRKIADYLDDVLERLSIAKG